MLDATMQDEDNASQELIAGTFLPLEFFDSDDMEQLAINGKAKAKSNGPIAADKIRTVMPLPTILGILDHVVASRIHARANVIAKSLPDGYLECAVKGRQVLDITFPANLIIEKGMDMV